MLISNGRNKKPNYAIINSLNHSSKNIQKSSSSSLHNAYSQNQTIKGHFNSNFSKETFIKLQDELNIKNAEISNLKALNRIYEEEAKHNRIIIESILKESAKTPMNLNLEQLNKLNEISIINELNFKIKDLTKILHDKEIEVLQLKEETNKLNQLKFNHSSTFTHEISSLKHENYTMKFQLEDINRKYRDISEDRYYLSERLKKTKKSHKVIKEMPNEGDLFAHKIYGLKLGRNSNDSFNIFKTKRLTDSSVNDKIAESEDINMSLSLQRRGMDDSIMCNKVNLAKAHDTIKLLTDQQTLGKADLVKKTNEIQELINETEELRKSLKDSYFLIDNYKERLGQLEKRLGMNLFEDNNIFLTEKIKKKVPEDNKLNDKIRKLEELLQEYDKEKEANQNEYKTIENSLKIEKEKADNLQQELTTLKKKTKISTNNSIQVHTHNNHIKNLLLINTAQSTMNDPCHEEYSQSYTYEEDNDNAYPKNNPKKKNRVIDLSNASESEMNILSPREKGKFFLLKKNNKNNFKYLILYPEKTSEMMFKAEVNTKYLELQNETSVIIEKNHMLRLENKDCKEKIATLNNTINSISQENKDQFNNIIKEKKQFSLEIEELKNQITIIKKDNSSLKQSLVCQQIFQPYNDLSIQIQLDLHIEPITTFNKTQEKTITNRRFSIMSMDEVLKGKTINEINEEDIQLLDDCLKEYEAKIQEEMITSNVLRKIAETEQKKYLDVRTKYKEAKLIIKQLIEQQHQSEHNKKASHTQRSHSTDHQDSNHKKSLYFGMSHLEISPIKPVEIANDKQEQIKPLELSIDHSIKDYKIKRPSETESIISFSKRIYAERRVTGRFPSLNELEDNNIIIGYESFHHSFDENNNSRLKELRNEESETKEIIDHFHSFQENDLMKEHCNEDFI